MPNLLINGDFQIWQRGTTFNGLPNTTGMNYHADMWKTYGFTKEQGSISKDENGLRFNNINMSNIYIEQVIDKLKVGENYILICSIDNEIKSSKLVGGNDKTEGNITYEVGLDDKDIIKIKIPIGNHVVNYVDLFEGHIAYKHQKEDKASALMRCQRKYIELDVVANIVYKYTETSALYSLTFPKMDAIPIIAYIQVQANDNNGSGMNAHLNDLTEIAIKQDFVQFRINWAKALAKEIGGHNCIIKLSCEQL